MYAGRGLESKGPELDDQIVRSLETGEVKMPLWGVSLDPEVAASYGNRFSLRIEGPFHGAAAWTHSGMKAAEREIITGGHYEVRPRWRDARDVHLLAQGD